RGYLEHSPGEANLNLRRMTPSGLSLEVQKLIRKAEMKNGSVRSDTIPISTKNQVGNVNITVTPISTNGQTEPLFLVALEEVAPPAPAGKKPAGRVAAPSDRRVRELQQELSSTREYLQA